jgi:hypothetical protein
MSGILGVRGFYVDDCLVLKKNEDIHELIVDLQLKVFLLKVERSLKDYLNCRVIEYIIKCEILILQPHLSIYTFGNEVSDGKRDQVHYATD